MRKLVRVIFWLVLVQAAAMAIGQLISSRITKGDERSDVFRLAAVCGGKRFRSDAGQLRSGSAIAAMGGLDIDLRHAKLDDEGAYLDLRAGMGGIRVVISPQWSVEMETDEFAGDCRLDATPADQLPKDAPRLTVHAFARMGGVLVTTDE